MPVTKTKSRRTKRLSFRATALQKRILKKAAESKGVTVTDYIVESAFKQAQRDILEERDFALSSLQWKRFTSALDRPAKKKPKLKKLLSKPSILEKR
ncbi:MAG: antitoxin [Elusimicrobia bacterium]|nr:MAG: antitoxin [Elusimicrobiota bacterium]